MSAMKKNTAVFVFLFSLSFFLGEKTLALYAPSAVRAPHESYKAKIFQLHLLKQKENNHDTILSPEVYRDVEKTAVRYNDLNFNLAQPWLGTFQELENAFAKIRDERIIKSDVRFPRRPTWLYPDDGCYARAELASNRLVQMGFDAPARIFAFGDLYVRTDNSPYGSVSWWYHVVVGYKFGSEIYIMDPSIESKKILTLKQWTSSMGDTATVELNICRSGAYSPNYDCNSNEQYGFDTAIREIKPFLKSEWNRILNLHRNPEAELGENPPWLSPTAPGPANP